MKQLIFNSFLLTFLIINLQCVSNPVTGGHDSGASGVWNVIINPNHPEEDMYRITLTHGLMIREITLIDRIRYEAKIIMNEKGYYGWLRASMWYEEPLLGRPRTVYEIRFVRTEDEMDSWRERYKN